MKSLKKSRCACFVSLCYWVFGFLRLVMYRSQIYTNRIGSDDKSLKYTLRKPRDPEVCKLPLVNETQYTGWNGYNVEIVSILILVYSGFVIFDTHLGKIDLLFSYFCCCMCCLHKISPYLFQIMKYSSFETAETCPVTNKDFVIFGLEGTFSATRI